MQFGKAINDKEGYEFDAVVPDDSMLPHPQRTERAVDLGFDKERIVVKYLAGEKIPI